MTEWTLNGYPCVGIHHILRWSAAGPSIVVARTTLPGRRWLRAVRRISNDGWHISAHKRKRDALSWST